MTALQGHWLHIDCFSGIAGDMTLAALIDLGVPIDVVTTALAAVGLGDVALTFAKVTRSSLAGLHLRAQRGDEIITPSEPEHHGHAHGPDDKPHHHRHYSEIRDRLLQSTLAPAAKTLALAIFAKLAGVEAERHGVPVDEVTFHEVGALDSILDVVGCAAALAWLQPQRVTVRTVPVGHGHVHTAHGELPIPAPATLALLTGFPIEDGGVAIELTTPTGAAILAAIATAHVGLPAGTPRAVGWGAGTKDLPGRPNLLRLVLLEPMASTPVELWQLETNLDDLSPQLCAPLVEALLAAGARDAWLVPILMKKGRPGFVVGALVEEAHRLAVETALFRNSTTLGLRRWPVERHELRRHHETLATPYGDVRVKVGTDPVTDAVRNAALEYEDVARLADQHGLTVKELYHRLQTLLHRS